MVVQNRHWKGNNGIGNGKAKELICSSHGHELRGGGGGMQVRQVVYGRVE